MVQGRRVKVEINQCIFGYEEGHRLLAASHKLPDEAASLLLLYSDLVPGLPSGSFKSYWTGVPIASMKSYALMHTWPAPEMPRPGCVWTHVLLINFADVAAFSNLGVLRDVFMRPARLGEYAGYARAISVETPPLDKGDRTVVPTHDLLRVLRALYAQGAKGILSGREGDCEDAIFAAWSQQWPRLRRSFSFRTAPVDAEANSSRFRFDLNTIPSLPTQTGATSLGEAAVTEPWERVALADLHGGSSEFRRFLWRYGSDQRRGKERFRFLAELYAATRDWNPSNGEAFLVLKHVAKTLPEPSDGKLLKEDLVSAGHSEYSVLPPIPPLSILEFFASGADQGSMPLPPETAFDAVHDLWFEQPTKILAVAERAARQNSVVADQILTRLSRMAIAEDFLEISRGHTLVREHMVAANPNLIDSEALLEVDQPELNRLLQLVSEPELAAKITKRLLAGSDTDAAELMMLRFPDVVERQVLDAVATFIVGKGPDVPAPWMEVVRTNQPASLALRLLSQAHKTSALAACASLLQFDVKAGLTVPSVTWANALVGAEDDVAGPFRQRLDTYLLMLALAQPMHGCEPIFERTFEPVHRDVRESRVPEDVFVSLAAVLPNLFWWDQWDTGLRLRVAVVSVYIDAGLDPQSFHLLTTDPSLFAQLVKIAERSNAGRHFLERI